MKKVTALWVMQARYRVPLAAAGPGNWVLIEGIDASVSKTATLVSEPMEARAKENSAVCAPPLSGGAAAFAPAAAAFASAAAAAAATAERSEHCPEQSRAV